MLFNKQLEAPFIPSFSSPADTKNFEKFSEEKIDRECKDIDQKAFVDF